MHLIASRIWTHPCAINGINSSASHYVDHIFNTDYKYGPLINMKMHIDLLFFFSHKECNKIINILLRWGKTRKKKCTFFISKENLQFHPLGFITYHFSVTCISLSWWAPYTDASAQPRQWSRA